MPANLANQKESGVRYGEQAQACLCRFTCRRYADRWTLGYHIIFGYCISNISLNLNASFLFSFCDLRRNSRYGIPIQNHMISTGNRASDWEFERMIELIEMRTSNGRIRPIQYENNMGFMV